MSFYTCFDWFKKLRLFVNERNLKIGVVLKASRAVVIRWFSLNEAPLGLFKFISDYLLYLKKNKYIFQYHNKKMFELRIDRNYLFGSFEITSIKLYTPLRISSWTEHKLRSILKYFKIFSWPYIMLSSIYNFVNICNNVLEKSTTLNH